MEAAASFSERTPMSSPFVSASARNNRKQISEIMLGCGFIAYPYEFWHYSQVEGYDLVCSGETRK